jgi:MFS family permease
VAALDRHWLQLAASLSATRCELISRVVLPGMLAHVLTGFRLALGVAWIVLVPAEYLYIDAIAPDALKGSYYGAQNLASLGGALGPAMVGALLSRGPSWVVFLVLALLCVAGAGLALYSERLRLRQDCARTAFPLPGSLS